MDAKFTVILGELKSRQVTVTAHLQYCSSQASRTLETRDNGVNQLFEYVAILISSPLVNHNIT
jgi:hypothetical protein